MRRYIFITLFVFSLLFILTSSNSRSTTQADSHAQKFAKATPATPQELQLAEERSYQYLAGLTPQYGIDSSKDLRVSKVEIDELAMAHTRMQQTYEGVPVFGGETIVHLNSDGSLAGITDGLVKNVSVNAQPDLSIGEAVERATNLFGCSDCLTETPKSDLMVLRHKGKDHLVYRVQLKRLGKSDRPAMPIYFIDAHTGKKVWGYDNLQSCDFPTDVTAHAKTHYYGGCSLRGWDLISTDDPYNGYGMILYSPTYSNICVYKPDVDNQAVPIKLDISFTQDSYRFNDVTSIADLGYGKDKITRYFKDVHNRDGIDGNNGPSPYPFRLISSACPDGSIDKTTYQSMAIVAIDDIGNDNSIFPLDNISAYWDGQAMWFRHINRNNSHPATSLDIMGHEYTHGVIKYTAGLTYSGESGALNESFADVFGTMIERYGSITSPNIPWNWKIGENFYTPNIAGDALRNMDDPHLGGAPDHYSERVTGTADNGGVHTNCSIANKVYYLLSVGGTHHKGGSMNGIGMASAEKIWYRAITTYMTSNTDFAGARTATLNAAKDLFGLGSAEYLAVGNAWGLCGVGQFEGIKNGGFETTLAHWIAEGNGIQYDSNTNISVDGTGMVSLANGSGSAVTNGKLYQQLTIPAYSTLANLSFYFGGSTGESDTAAINDKLFVEICDQNGNVLQTLATYSNKDLGIFGPDFQKKGNFSLLAYKGQTIRLQFRTETNATAGTLFSLDAVSLATTN